MLPVVSAVRIDSGENWPSASRFGARESEPGCWWHVAHDFWYTAAPSGACADAVEEARTTAANNPNFIASPQRSGLSRTLLMPVVSTFRWTSYPIGFDGSRPFANNQ